MNAEKVMRMSRRMLAKRGGEMNINTGLLAPTALEVIPSVGELFMAAILYSESRRGGISSRAYMAELKAEHKLAYKLSDGLKP